MAETTLKYGLTAALRSIKVPDAWEGKETISMTGFEEAGAAITHTNEFLGTQQQGKVRVFTVPKNTQGELHIKRTIDGNCASHTTIHVQEGCSIKILDTIEGAGTYAASTVLTITGNSTVEYAILQDMDTQSLALLNYEAAVNDSKLHWFFCGVGADTTQAHLGTAAGENSEIINNAVLFGTGKQQFDIHVATKHVGHHSRSDMLTRSVLDDQARAVYHGLINIGKDSPECDSYQKDEVILLSDKAGADAIPNLEINNNKVRCTHGASIGKLDQEKLFYFLSRGIERTEAKRIITEGFLEPLFIAPWQHKIHEKISRSLKAE